MKRKMVALILFCVFSTTQLVCADTTQDRIDKIKKEIAILEAQLEKLEKKQAAENPNLSAENKSTYMIGESWIVPDQWKLTIDGVEETLDRNEYSDLNPGAVYIVTFTYENLGYVDELGDGLYFVMDDNIVDSDGKMGYSYPGDITLYPQNIPIGAYCQGQVCIGVDHPGTFQINVAAFDSTDTMQRANFTVSVN